MEILTYITNQHRNQNDNLGQRLPDTSIVILHIPKYQQNEGRLKDPKSSVASAGISIASLEVGSATVVLLSVLAQVLYVTCKINIRKSWTRKVQGMKTISLQKLSESKTQTIPRY